MSLLTGMADRAASGIFARLQTISTRGSAMKLVAKYGYSRECGYFPEGSGIQQGTMSCCFLFDSYSRLDWETRLALLEGVTTWLQSDM
jgi:hypothetical protein